MSKTARNIIGYAMIASIFLAIFVACLVLVGIVKTVLIFAIIAAIFAYIGVAVCLITFPSQQTPEIK